VSLVTGVPSVLVVGGVQVNVAVPEAAVTPTVMLCVPVPPVPVQLSEYVVAALSAPVDLLPLLARVPLQPPDAMQEDALLAVQVRVDAPPCETLLGLALKVTVGAAAATVTVAD
jgi:hypothetical protein